MNGIWTLFIDQYGNRFSSTTVSELRGKIGNGKSRIARMYRDTKNGQVIHCGYVIGGHWLTAYRPVEIPIN